MCQFLKLFSCLLAVLYVGNFQQSPVRAETPETATPAAPKGFILVEEEMWTSLSDEPGRHMDRAREYFLVMDARKAAAELRKAAIYLKVSSRQAMENTGAAIGRSAHELERLAHRVEMGTVNSVDELDAASARALHALSNDHYAKATEAWEKRELKRSGHYLQAAAENLERANARTRDALKTGTHEIAKDSRVVAGKLVKGTGIVVDEIGAGFEAFGRQLERVGHGLGKTTDVR